VLNEVGFEGRVAIVTGAARGLGREHSLLLASRGAAVVVNDVGCALDGTGADASIADGLARAIRSAGGEATSDAHDVSTRSGGAALVELALQTYGRVDIVVNNAGILRDRTMQNVAPDELDAVLGVHLKGAFNVSKPAFALMREQGYGRIVSTSSGAGLFGNFGQAAYGAAKMALVGLTRVLAVEGARRGILANAIAPIAHTRMTRDLMGPEGEAFLPSLVAPVVGFLCSEACDVSGEVYSVGAGRVARVFVAEARGICSSTLTIEDVRDRLTDIRAEAGYAVPIDMPDNMRLFQRALAHAAPQIDPPR